MEFVLSRQPKAGAAEERSAGPNGACNPALHNGFCPDGEWRRGLLSHYRMSKVSKKFSPALDISLQVWMPGTQQWAVWSDLEMLPRDIFCFLLNVHEKRFVESQNLSQSRFDSVLKGLQSFELCQELTSVFTAPNLKQSARYIKRQKQ